MGNPKFFKTLIFDKLLVTSKNSLTDESTALSSALFHKIPSRSSCYACEFLFELPNKLLAARSAIEFLEVPKGIYTHFVIKKSIKGLWGDAERARRYSLAMLSIPLV